MQFSRRSNATLLIWDKMPESQPKIRMTHLKLNQASKLCQYNNLTNQLAWNQMDGFSFNDDFDFSDFSVHRSLTQDILSDNFDICLPMVNDFKEDEEDDLFQSSSSRQGDLEDLLYDEEVPLEKEDPMKEVSECGSNFYIQESGSTEIDKKKPKNKKSKASGSRKKDQNMCKKYNLVAQNVIGKRLKLTAVVEQFRNCKHRQDFFIIMVISADKAGRLEAFKKLYRSEIEKLRKNCAQLMKQTFKESHEFKKHQALLDAIEKSFKSIQLYEDNRLEDAILALYDLENLRNKKFIEKSIEFVRAISRTTNI